MTVPGSLKARLEGMLDEKWPDDLLILPEQHTRRLLHVLIEWIDTRVLTISDRPLFAGDLWALYEHRCKALLKSTDVVLEGPAGVAFTKLVSVIHETLRVLVSDVLDGVIRDLTKKVLRLDGQISNTEFALIRGFGEMRERLTRAEAAIANLQTVVVNHDS